VKRTRLRLVLILLIVAVSPLPVSAVGAADPHEDPDTVKPIYSLPALIQYYVETQDYALTRDDTTVQDRLDRMLYANIDERLKPHIQNINQAERQLAATAAANQRDLEQLNAFLRQSRISEAAELAPQIGRTIASGYEAVVILERLFPRLPAAVGASVAPGSGFLADAYTALIAKTAQKRELLDRDSRALASSILAITGPHPQPTDLSLSVSPLRVFVGEPVSVTGTLTAGDAPLPGREVEVMLNGRPAAVLRTNVAGIYEGSLVIPYEYIPDMEVFALYLPQGEDTGHYLASRSPDVMLDVRYFPATIDLTLPGEVYPGVDFIVRGRFDYRDAPAPASRPLEIYFDDVPLARVESGVEFESTFNLEPSVGTGKHILTIAAPGMGIYSPTTATAQVTVVIASPVLYLGLPAIILFPGSFDTTGRVDSDLGPVSGARIKLSLSGVSTEATSGEDGLFTARLTRPMSLTFLGSQYVYAAVEPAQPWLSAAEAAFPVFVLNWVFTIMLFAVMAVAVLLVRRRLSRTGRIPAWLPDAEPTRAPAIAAPVPETATPVSAVMEIPFPQGSPQSQLLTWYRRVAAVIGQILKTALPPSETLREFLTRVIPFLGPAGSIFSELTTRAERALYSRWRPSEQDAEEAMSMSQGIEGNIRRPG